MLNFGVMHANTRQRSPVSSPIHSSASLKEELRTINIKSKKAEGWEKVTKGVKLSKLLKLNKMRLLCSCNSYT